MLRYFYILVCIEVCFCTDYIDNTGNELEQIESATARLHKKQTEKTKKSGIVQFDVQNFMKRADEGVSNVAHYVYKDRSRENGQYSANYGDYASFIESNENNQERNDAIDYSKVDDSLVEWNGAPRPVKEVKLRQSKNAAYDNSKIDGKAHAHVATASTNNLPNMLTDGIISNPEKKCAFKNMKVPFFSSNKLTTKDVRHHKRRMFCFNCHKTTASTTSASTSLGNVDEVEKNDSDDLNFNYELVTGDHLIHKRAYDQLCPKCIRELLNNLKRKTTKKIVHQTKPFMDKTKSFKEKTTSFNKKDDNLDDNLKEDYFNQGYVRKKRNEKEDMERERRLKELDEVERKIENVHISSQAFNARKINLNVDNNN